MTLAAVSETGPLIHLAEIDSLDLLSAFDEMYIPGTVYQELEAVDVPKGLNELRYELVEPNESRTYATELDAGETAALPVAKERGVVLPTDDLAARNTAWSWASKYTALSALSHLAIPAVCAIETKLHPGYEPSSTRRVSP